MRVVQFGEGVFLRGFADWMFHRLNHEAGTDVRVTLVEPRNTDGVARFMEQGGSYTVVQQGLVDGEAQSVQYLVDCIDGWLNTHEDPAGFRRLARDEAVRVVLSNTTEAGIVWSDADAEMADARHHVRSFPGKLTWFLSERHASPARSVRLFILPCELIADNGQELRRLVIRMARAWELGSEFEDWLEGNVEFLDTLVDRITPGAPRDQAYELAPGEPDAFPVQVEWFHSWYFRGSRDLLEVLPLDALDFNVRFVENLRPYRDLKVRVLNGLHSSMAPAGLAGQVHSVAEAVDHPVIGRWLARLLEREVIPTLDLPSSEIDQFVSATWERFRNPYIHHRLENILLNSSAKIPARLGAIVSEGNASPLIAAGVACWLHLSRTTELADADETLARLRELWRRHADGAISLEDVAQQALADPAVLGRHPWPDPFRDAVSHSLGAIASLGVVDFLAATIAA